MKDLLKINADLADLLFRGLFCLIFVGLGAEHIFPDSLIQRLMPEWMPYPRLTSIACGLWLSIWGWMILIGWRIQLAAACLAVFLAVVTVLVHVPGVMINPAWMSEDHLWLWDILQRTNLVKNLCLLGVCFHLLHHKMGRYSLESYLTFKTTPL